MPGDARQSTMKPHSPAGREDASDRAPSGLTRDGQSWAARRFTTILITVCVTGLLVRLLVLQSYLTHNPMAQNPVIDAATYWNWADRIAHGEFSQNVPFFSAPLYPYLLGLLRAIGGTLTTVYVLQIGMDLVTTALLGLYARRHFGPGTGLLSVALFLLLQEPASFALRILPSSLHLLLVTLGWGLMTRVQDSPSPARRLGLGVVLGLLCLSYPPATLIVLLTVPWLFWQSRRKIADLARAVIPAALAFLLIAPATLHNYRASGEFFLIQALSGVTLRLGNQPGADGVYHPIPGVSMSREHMLHDAARVYQQATGNPPSWSATDAYFRSLSYDFWRSNPGGAIQLAGRKLYWFLTGRNYGDIYQPNAEIAAGLTPRLRLAPIQTPWLIIPGLIGLTIHLRHPIRQAPTWLMVAVPLIVVTTFWYSPRYRLPAVPVLTVTAAWALAGLSQWRARPIRAAVVLGGVVLAICTGPLNRATGFDPAWSRDVAIALAQKGNSREAESVIRSHLASHPGDASATSALGYVYQITGRVREAREAYETVLRLDPTDMITRSLLGSLLVQTKEWDEAARQLRVVLDASPDHAESNYNMGMALTALNRHAEALPFLERALDLFPRNVQFLHGMGVSLARQQRYREAAAWFRRALAVDPTHQKSLRDLQQAEKLLNER